MKKKFSPASVILFGEVTLLLSTPPNKASSALLPTDWLPPRPPSIVGLRLGVKDWWVELRWWPPAPPPELRLPSRLRVRWPASLGLLLDPPITKACRSVFKEKRKKKKKKKSQWDHMIGKKKKLKIALQGTVKDKLPYITISIKQSCFHVSFFFMENID